MKLFIELDCAQKRDRPLSISTFDRQGNLIGLHGNVSEWDYIPPDSPIEAISGVICTNNYSDTMETPYTLDVMAKALFCEFDTNCKLKSRLGKHQ